MEKTDTEKYAQILIQEPNIVKTFSDMYKEEDELYKIFVEHLERTYGEEWIVVVALKARILMRELKKLAIMVCLLKL